jgi:small subunit ribosomal protein S18
MAVYTNNKRKCNFCAKNIRKIPFEPSKLRSYLTERGKILPRRITGICAYHQRQISKAIKKARNLNILL